MNDREDQPPVRYAPGPTIVPVFAHVVAWLVLVIALSLIVPRFEATFRNFGVELPAMAMLVVKISHFVTRRWYVLLVLLGGWLALDWAVLSSLGRDRGTRGLARLWTVLMFLLPIAILVLVPASLMLVLTMLQARLTG